jgi:hypothetical protein
LVADSPLLAPRLLPAGIRRPSIYARYGAVMRLGLTREIKAQVRRRQDRPAEAAYLERGATVLHGDT